MKQILRKTFLVLVAGIMSSAAWADTTLVGSANNTNDFWAGTLSEIYDIAPNKTLKLEFTSYIKAEGWNVWEAWVSQFWDLQEKNVFVRADGYGWQAGDGGKNTNPYDAGTNTAGYDPANPWFSYNAANYPAVDAFHDALQEASVVYTFKRINAEVIVTQEVTKGSNTYKHEFVCFFGDGTRNISVQLATEKSHIIIDNDKTTITDSEIPAISGTLLGCLSQRGRFGAGQKKDFTLAAGGSMKLHFKNFTSKLNNWSNWILELQKGTDYLDLRCDNYGWGTYWAAVSCTQSDGYFDNFVEKMDGADVEITITRNSSNLLIVAKHTPKVGDVFTETYNYTNDVFSSGEVTVRLLTDCSYLDLLSTNQEVYATIGSKGWTTFANADYALDFASVDGLTAYQITDQTGKVITKSEVTSAVQKNTGLLLNGTAGTTYTIPVAASGTALSGNKLVAGTGSAISMASGHTYYVLTYEDGDAQFKKLTSAVAVPVGKAYLDFPTIIEARSIDIEGDGTTGINMVNGEGLKVNGSGVYDLSGRFIGQWSMVNGQLKPGLYIVNGKKVILK